MPEAKHFAVTEWHSPLTVILSRQAKDPPSQRPALRLHGAPSLYTWEILRKLRMTQRDG